MLLPYPSLPVVASIEPIVAEQDDTLHYERGHLAATRLLQLLLRCPIQVAHTALGKPFLPQEPFALSIAHSTHYIAVWLAPPSFSVGIDIEEPREQLLSVAPRIMNRDELTHFHSLSNHSDALNYALEVWCAKEATYKALPCPSASFRNDYGFHNDAVLYSPENLCLPVSFFRHPNYLLASVALCSCPSMPLSKAHTSATDGTTYPTPHE